MIAAYHLVWTVYGYWLPNDPRGSMSHTIRNPVVAELGDIHYGRKRIQRTGRVLRDFHDAAQRVLQYRLLDFSTAEVEAIATAFGNVIASRAYTCYGCAIMPDHVHILVRKHRYVAEAMIERLQDESRIAVLGLCKRGASHPVWGGPGWKVYLETREDIVRTIRYIDGNPRKSRLPPQTWPFVKRYDGWLSGQVRIVRRSTKVRGG
jgi:REP element-mobilizing transposase RayT